MQRFINNWAATLAAPAASADLQMTLNRSLPELAAGDTYLLTLIGQDTSGSEIAWEIIKVNGTAAGIISVERAQEGTPALDWPAGSRLELRLTAGYLNDLQASMAALSTRLAALEIPANALTDSAGQLLTDTTGNTLTLGVPA